MGKLSEAELLRIDFAAKCGEYEARIGNLEGNSRVLAAQLAGVTAERDGLRVTCTVQGEELARLRQSEAEWAEKYRTVADKLERTQRLIRRSENPNSPTSSRAICNKERDKLRRQIGSYNEGDVGQSGDEDEGEDDGGGWENGGPPGPEGEEAAAAAGGGRVSGRRRRGGKRRGGAGNGAGKAEAGANKGGEGKEKEEEEGRKEDRAARRRRGPGRSNTTKTECTLNVELGPSKCCNASHVVIGYVVKRHYDLIGGWLLEHSAAGRRGRLLQDLARDAVRTGGVGRACAVALKFEVGCCSACGLIEWAKTPISIPGSALGVIVRERILDLTDYMYNQDVADYVAWYYGLDISANTVANAVSASMDASRRLVPRIVDRICENGYAVIDEALARIMGRWGYVVAACRGGAVLFGIAHGRSEADLEEAVGKRVWRLPKVTDEHGAYKDAMRQSDHVHHPRSAEEPVYVSLSLIGKFAKEAGIDPAAEFEAVKRAVVPPLVDLIASDPGVKLAEGAVLPSVAPIGEECGEGGGGGGKKSRRARGGPARIAARAGLPSPSQRRPTPETIAAYRRDSVTYFGLLCFYLVIRCINRAPPHVVLALQRVLCTILGGYGDSHPVKTRYENAMACLFRYAQVDDMPPHSNDVERAIRNGPRRYMKAHVQIKGPRGIAAGATKMTITANARNHGMPVGRAATYAIAYPEWSILDGPPEGDPPIWMPPGGPRGGGGDGG